MERRLRKGKNITGNTGNYVGALMAYASGTPLIGDLYAVNTFAVGPVYGIQRTYKKGFFYRLETGVTYYEDTLGRGVSLVLAARIGWVIRKKR